MTEQECIEELLKITNKAASNDLETMFKIIELCDKADHARNLNGEKIEEV